jgi:hypothetical protein
VPRHQVGASCRFRKFRSLGGTVNKVWVCRRMYPGRVATLPAHAHPDLAPCPRGYLYRSEDQDIEFPARLARQRQEPAEHPSRSYLYDDVGRRFFQFLGLDSSVIALRRKTASTKEAGLVSIRLAA